MTLAVFAIAAGAANDPSDKNVTPTVVDLGGQNFDCRTTQVNSGAQWDFRVINPVDGRTYTDNRTGASFRISLDANQIFLGFTGTKAAVYDLVIKGGSKSSWYNYDATNGPGPVTSDSKLHAPPKGNSYFAVSHVSFCYSNTATISGTVYNDLDGNGALTANSPEEAGLGGWTVRAYNNTGAVVGSVGSASNGSYILSNIPIGATYAVCATPSSGLWSLSEPTTTPGRCSSSPVGRGWEFELNGNATKNFGAQSAVRPDCYEEFSGTAFGSAAGNVEYSAQLVPQDGDCKDSALVMYSYEPNTNQLFATLNPPTEDASDPWEVVEHIRWTGITLDTQNPITLWYDDVAPYDGVSRTNLIPCDSDPRDDPTSFALPASHPELMPAGHTSCLLASTDSAGSGPDDRSYEAWIYSEVDGSRGFS
jgi:hypothetical protein